MLELPRRHSLFRLALLTVAFAIAELGAQPFSTRLQVPQRILFTPAGNLLVSEGGTAEANSGRVSLVDRGGIRRSLLEGLPSGLAHFTNPFGPTGMALDGRTLYLLLGEGDVMAGGPPNYGINANGPSSPIFSSILKIQFNREPDEIQESFRLSSVSHWALLDGYDETLQNGAGDHATIELLTAFRPVVRTVLGNTDRVRPANPYSVVLDASRRYLYVADASAETISRVDTTTGRSVVLLRFEPYMRATPSGPAPVDNVPASLCWSGDKLMVGFLTASPLPPGEEVRLLTGDATTALASGFRPTGVAVEPRTGDIYVAVFTGLILRIAAP
jgi:DNA-binding beta-propeller fold protein YncE